MWGKKWSFWNLFQLTLIGTGVIIAGLLTGCFHSSGGSGDRNNGTDSPFPSNVPEDIEMEPPQTSPTDPPDAPSEGADP